MDEKLEAATVQWGYIGVKFSFGVHCPEPWSVAVKVLGTVGTLGFRDLGFRVQGLFMDNGKENGSFYSTMGYIGVMEGIMETNMETFI